MNNLRRGTALFNILLGFPEPKPAPLPPRPIQEYTLEQATIAGLVKEADLWLDAKTFRVSFWPRPDHPHFNSYANLSMRNRGCKFFDFNIASEWEGEFQRRFVGYHVWTPTSNGTLDMQILNNVFAHASDWRTLTLQEFADFCGEDPANDYLELRWNFASRCALFTNKLGMDLDILQETRQEILEMMYQDGEKVY